MRKKSVITVIIVAVVVCLGLGVFAGVHFYQKAVNQKAFEREITQNSLTGDGEFITITKDMDVKDIAGLLQKKKVILYPNEFEKQAEKIGLKTGYVPGSYRIVPGISYEEIAKQLCRKSDAAIIRFTIPEGYEVRNIVDKLVSLDLVTADKFYDVMNHEDFDYDFLKDLPERSVRLEGYLFPDTYEVRADAGEEYIINMMLKRFDMVFTDTYKKQAQKMNMSVDQVVTLASVIEREAGSAQESKKVSGVFHNRLEKGMRLQSCATVQYILKKRKPVLSTADTKIDSPYNTYRYAGLPVGPIASPGKTSIEAALYPAKTNDLYFVLGKDGKHVFSETYQEHLAAKNQAEAQ